MSLKDLKARSDKALDTLKGGSQPDQRESPRPTTVPGAAAFMQPTIDALNERAKAAERQAEDLRRQLALQPSEVDIDLLDQVPGRKRNLTPEEYAELKENLRVNELINPVTVAAKRNGRYEIISGHNRTDIYKELGRRTIRIVVLDIEGASVERHAFFANLLQTPLPDYEKYLGFRRERETSKASQKELAMAAGIPESKVSMLFAFEALPAKALELVAMSPHALGMNAAAELSRLTRSGREALVVQAVELLVSGKLSQKEAVQYAGRRIDRPAPAAPASAIRIRAGRAEFCQYVSRDKILRIEFKSAEDREEAERRVAEVLEAMAKEGRAGSRT